MQSRKFIIFGRFLWITWLASSFCFHEISVNRDRRHPETLDILQVVCVASLRSLGFQMLRVCHISLMHCTAQLLEYSGKIIQPVAHYTASAQRVRIAASHLLLTT